MIEVLASVLGASLLGSPHCAGMCGGFVSFYAGANGARPLSHAAYNAGRLVSYVTLGALAGLAGAGLDRAGGHAGLPQTAALVAGSFMVLWGVGALLAAAGVRLPAPAFARPAHHLVAAVLRRLADRPPVVRAAAMGLVTTLLPCGFLHVFVATAAGTGSPLRGALLLAAFWLGTVPVMAGLGVLAQRAIAPLRARLPLVSAALVVVAGVLTLAGKLHLATAGAAHVCR